MINLRLINTLSKSVNFSLKNIVNNYTDFLTISDIYNDKTVPLEYIQIPELTSEKNLTIIDNSWMLHSNSLNTIANIDNVFFLEGREFLLPYKKVLFSNVVRNGEPLFYQHKLKSNLNVLDASIYSVSNMQTQTETGFVFDKTNGAIYTNYQNYFDYKNSFYKIYYVTYTLSDNNSYQEILNPEPFIKELSFLDIDTSDTENYGNIKNGITRYVMTPSYGQSGFLFEIQSNISEIETLCTEDTTYEAKGFYAKFLESNIIKLKKPESIYLDNPWYVRINNSEIFNGNNLYKIPEYDKQAFNPVFGISWYLQKDCSFVNANILKLPNENISFNPQADLHCTLYVYDSDESLLNVYTTNRSLINSNPTYEAFNAISVDEQKGFLYSNIAFDSQHIYKLDYYLELNDYVYNRFDFNPVNNKRIINHKVAFYMLPNKYSITEMSDLLNQSAVRHLLINEDDLIVDAPYDTQYKGQSYTDFLSNAGFVLGEVKIDERLNQNEILNFSLIERDYVSKKHYKDLLNRNPTVLQSFLGYGEAGQIIKRNNTIMVKVPYDLFIEHGGYYTEAQLKEILVSRLGLNRTLVLLKDYRKPKILSITKTNDVHTIICTWEGLGTYKLWFRETKDAEKEFLISTNSTSRPSSDILTFEVNVSTITSNNCYYSISLDTDELESNIYGVVR